LIFFLTLPPTMGRSSCWRPAYAERVSRTGTGGQEVLDLLSLAGTAVAGNIPRSLTFISHPSARAGPCPLLPSPLDVSFSLFTYFLFFFLSPTLQSQHCSSL